MSVHRIFSFRYFQLLLMLAALGSCTGTLDHVELDPQTVGYQSALPKAGTRVVVWGNHAMAVDNASIWLHQRGMVVLDRTKIQQGLNDEGVRLTGSSKDWAHVLKAGKTAGSDLVTFVEVSNIKEGQKFALSQVRSAPTFSLTVEIRGVKPDTGEVVTKSKAWQTGPAENSDFVIEDLTARALDGAWKTSTSEYKVITVNKGEDLEKIQMNRNALSAPQEARAGENVNGNGAESASGIDLNGENREEIIQEQQIQRPLSVIATQNASAHDELENDLVAAKSASSSDDHAMLNSEERSRNSVATGVTTKPIMDPSSPTLSDSHDEVDSTYLKEFEPPPSQKQSPGSSDSVGVHIASGALSILYTPAKLVYAGLGGIFGSLAYVLTAGDEQTAGTIWSASLDGDYYLTPAHLKGDSPIRFMGSSSGGAESVANRTHSKEPFVAHSSAFK